MTKFEVTEVVRHYDEKGDLLARYQPGTRYHLNAVDQAFVNDLVSQGKATLIEQRQCPGGTCILGEQEAMADNAAEKVKGALDGVVAKIEKATNTVVANLENVTNDTVNKLGRIEDKFGGMFKSVNASLDEMIDGHNGGPPLDEKE